MIFTKRAKHDDIDRIMELIEAGRELLKQSGSTQWQDGNPTSQTIKADIDNRESFVLMLDNKIVATCAMTAAIEPDYDGIIDGKWANDEAYYTIHRVSVDPEHRGKHLIDFLFSNLMTIAKEEGINNIRIDTHRSNKRMQALVERHGFEYRGVVFVNDNIDRERLAYELNMEL